MLFKFLKRYSMPHRLLCDVSLFATVRMFWILLSVTPVIGACVLASRENAEQVCTALSVTPVIGACVLASRENAEQVCTALSVTPVIGACVLASRENAEQVCTQRAHHYWGTCAQCTPTDQCLLPMLQQRWHGCCRVAKERLQPTSPGQTLEHHTHHALSGVKGACLYLCHSKQSQF